MKTIAALALVCCAPLLAQDNAMVNLLIGHLKTSKQFTIAVAGQMPPDQYAFKLTAPQMSFAEQMIHISNANGFFFGKMFGAKGPTFDPKKADKTTVIADLNSSFDFAIATLGGINDAKLREVVDTGDGKMTALEGVMLTLDHTTNHRASSEMYLRAKGITPTEYKF